MELIEKRVGNVVIIAVRGEADHVTGYKNFRSLINSRTGEGVKSFVLNLEECSRLDSMGIGEFVRTLFHVMRDGGSLKLACVPHKIKGLLAITNLSQIFEIFDDEASAVASFG